MVACDQFLKKGVRWRKKNLRHWRKFLAIAYKNPGTRIFIRYRFFYIFYVACDIKNIKKVVFWGMVHAPKNKIFLCFSIYDFWEQKSGFWRSIYRPPKTHFFCSKNHRSKNQKKGQKTLSRISLGISVMCFFGFFSLAQAKKTQKNTTEIPREIRESVFLAYFWFFFKI